MTVAQLSIDRTSFPSLLRSGGVSEEADNIRQRLKKVLRDRLESITLGETYFEAFEALQDAFEECSSENWDGYGAAEIDLIAYAHALEFLEALPTTLPAPDVAVEPDGEIAFEWYVRPRWVFSVSVGRDNELTYAGLFGRSKTHGTEYFADELPKTIIENLDRLLSKEARQSSFS
ncbi:hypothetical protein MYX65_10720 [Acidobacteria bacterium AH-259-L09]|nr:hypothetical protein [Acidobacteria bacterium AH-259-L09]